MNRRKRRRRQRTAYRKSGVKSNVISVVLVICMSVGAGYLTSTYLLGPALGIDVKPSFFNIDNEEKDKKEEPQNINQVVEDTLETDNNESGYALQYGSFSSRAGAEECAESLKKSGIEARIIEKDNAFKVIGQLFDTKEEARTHKDQSTVSGEIFITEIP